MSSRVIEDFYSSLPFEPDDFQRQAIAATEQGATVVVTAPTGSGKTLVAEAAVVLALAAGKRAFYTTPIKALSNQKYGDLTEVHGKDRVGLLTGDNVINGDAAVVVMTTEVLRNMIYAGSDALDRVAVVILDEVHYLQDRFRGAVWEEIIIHAPRRIQLVCLSATVANAEEFAAWIEERRGRVELIVSKHRPIPLEDLYCWRDRFAQEVAVMPTFVSKRRGPSSPAVSPPGEQTPLPAYGGTPPSEGRNSEFGGSGPKGRGGKPGLPPAGGETRANPKIERLLGLERGRRHRFSTPNRSEVIEHLAEAGLLPAIYFIFSRAGCDAAALRLLESGIRLTSADDRERIRLIAEEGTAHLGDDDLDALEYDRWVSFLEAGIAPHHAGMVPAFKETVEELFATGFLKVVFATETLALGINMPARTVVLESLSKWSGEGHEVMSAGDYTQLTGRAGRRGIDTAGFGMVLHSPFVPFAQVVEVAAAGSHPLRSSFRPTYNMAANLCATYDRPRALELVSSSFAQFQRQESQAQAEERLQVLSERLVDEEARAVCELGSVTEYRAILASQPRRPDNDDLIGKLRPGDVIDVPGGPRQGRFLILRRIRREGGGMKLLALGTSGRTVPLGKKEIVQGTSRRATLTLPQPMDTKSRRFQSDALRLLRKVPASGPEGPDVVKEVEIDHPVARCPERDSHLRWAARAERTQKRVEDLRSELRRSGIGLVEDFEAIERLLELFRYMSGWALTPRGERLRFVYNELDLLLAEALERGLFYGLTVPELAALASSFVYEPRSDEKTIPLWPTPELARRWETLVLLSSEIAGEERRQHLPVTREPDPGFVGLAYQWADGSALDDLTGLRLAPGDFVRVARQLVDLLRQIRDVSPEVADVARETLAAVDRGVVAAMGVG